MSKAKIPSEEEYEIVSHIRDAKDKRKQLQIEADLHCISVTQVKAILKEHGFNLRQLNGANLMKKAEPKEGIPVGIGDDNKGEAWTPAVDEKSEQVGTEAEQAKQWAEIAIPPVENIITDVQDIPKKEIKYKKPEIIEPPTAKRDKITVVQAIAALYERVAELNNQRNLIDEELSDINVQLNRIEEYIAGRLEEVKP